MESRISAESPVSEAFTYFSRSDVRFCRKKRKKDLLLSLEAKHYPRCFAPCIIVFPIERTYDPRDGCMQFMRLIPTNKHAAAILICPSRLFGSEIQMIEKRAGCSDRPGHYCPSRRAKLPGMRMELSPD